MSLRTNIMFNRLAKLNTVSGKRCDGPTQTRGTNQRFPSTDDTDIQDLWSRWRRQSKAMTMLLSSPSQWKMTRPVGRRSMHKE